METFLHQLLSGLATGGIYASIALALVMIYQATHLVNFAQGEMAMFSTYVAWTLIESGFPYWAAFCHRQLAMSFVVGVVIERAIIRPIASKSELAVVVVFIGLLLIFNSLAGWIWTHSLKTFPCPFSAAVIPGSKYLSAHEIGAMLITLVELARSMCSSATRRSASPCGPPPTIRSRAVWSASASGWMLALGWGLAAAIGAIAGMMVAHVIYLDPNMMTGILLYGFAGALLGGIDNPAGAVVGGFHRRCAENVLGAYVIGTDLKLTVALVVIVAVLTVRPSGLFGKSIVTRV